VEMAVDSDVPMIIGMRGSSRGAGSPRAAPTQHHSMAGFRGRDRDQMRPPHRRTGPPAPPTADVFKPERRPSVRDWLLGWPWPFRAALVEPC